MFPRDADQQREMIYNEQVKTNALLEQMISMQKQPEITKATVIKPNNKKPIQRTRRKAQ